MKHLKISSILVIILGTIHILATPIIVLPMFKTAELMFTLTFLYMFFITGVAIVFVGWLQYYLAKNHAESVTFRAIFTVSIIFILLIGVGAVATMWNNPFAYLSLLIAIYQLVTFKRISIN